MKSFFKKIIRKLYWRYAHDGDIWQAQIVMYHMSNVIQMHEDKPMPDSIELFFGEINEKLSGQIEGFGHLRLKQKIKVHNKQTN